jgi:hypothetical protein
LHGENVGTDFTAIIFVDDPATIRVLVATGTGCKEDDW